MMFSPLSAVFVGSFAKQKFPWPSLEFSLSLGISTRLIQMAASRPHVAQPSVMQSGMPPAIEDSVRPFLHPHMYESFESGSVLIVFQVAVYEPNRTKGKR